MRVEKRTLRQAAFIQNLFNNNIDFENNVVPDSVSGYDASFTNYAKSLKWTNTGASANIFRCLETNIDINNNFTVVFRGVGASGSSGDRFRWIDVFDGVPTRAITIQNENAGTTTLQIFGVNVATSTLNLQSLEGIVILVKEANNYKVYYNSTLVINYTGTHTFNASFPNRTFTSGQNDFSAEIRDFAIFEQTALNSTQVATLVDSYSIFNLAKNTANSEYFGFGENNINIQVGCLKGYKSLPTATGLSIINETYLKFPFNQKVGFDVYLDVSLNKYYISLNANTGLSFGLDLSAQGLTYSATYTQNGNEFLPDETKFKQPVEASLIAKDTANFYYTAGVSKEISFDDLQTAPPYINYVLSNGKITNLTI